MPRPPNVIRPTRLELKLPQDVRAWLDLHLWSDVEQRVPLGAYQALFLKLIRDYREKVEPRASVPGNTGEDPALATEEQGRADVPG